MAGWGWIDLLSSIPVIGALRWGRVARIFRILRVIRAIRSARVIGQFLVHQRAQSAFLAAVLLTLLVLVLASIAILQVEPVGGGNIKSPEDALWWAMTTMVTVGYGDVYPVTTEGRFVAVFVMISGVGLFGTLSGLIASWFLADTEKKQEQDLEEIRTLLAQLRKER